MCGGKGKRGKEKRYFAETREREGREVNNTRVEVEKQGQGSARGRR